MPKYQCKQCKGVLENIDAVPANCEYCSTLGEMQQVDDSVDVFDPRAESADPVEKEEVESPEEVETSEELGRTEETVDSGTITTADVPEAASEKKE